MTTFDYSLASYSPPLGGSVMTPILSGTGVTPIEKGGKAIVALIAEFQGEQRLLAEARDRQDRLDEHRVDFARAAGARGEAVDHAYLAQYRVSVIEEVALRELDVEALATRLGQERDSYLETLRSNQDQLVAAATKVHQAAIVRLNSARSLAEDAAATLEGTVRILGAAPLIVSGQMNIDLRGIGPRTSADHFADAGHPATHAQAAASDLLKAVGWAARWVEHSENVLQPQWRGEVTPEAAAKAAAEQAEAEAYAKWVVS